ncbi:SDR family NAD(P)-dependent oxidoreductase [Prochlorococcus sp. MIT 1307]|uniref:SDR family NAD(P)-dependent oxidoreductase n=1 Tax=Prochlorococcus sp. MIT 1307 TaxID=3096219 RepID=UPI002A750311|nr:SDR family NAD(P)-dependent oxidoreductase [Prochlorococcus sp. MIT 1307]
MRTILISGASRGIGRAIALKALEDGHRISLGIRDLNSVKGSKLDPDISGSNRVILNHYEGNSPQTAKDWISATLDHFQKLDSLINCAGIFNRTKFLFSDSEEGEIEQLWRVNVMAPWFLTKEAWGEISKDGQGRVMFLVSLSGKRSKSNLAGYCMSKFALMGLCQTIRNEGWDSGIRVTAICPSWVNTDMASGIKSISQEEMTQPNDLASIVSNLLTLPNTCIPFEIEVNCNLEK